MDKSTNGKCDIVVHNTEKWIEENQQFFSPPVCNKMMHQHGQMKLFFVGGPNIRKDFHIEEGEEFFYQVKGDMMLKVVEHGKHRDIIIKEGEVFLLPGRVPHSPQRYADTVGLVVERERLKSEQDCLRYYMEKGEQLTLNTLYEKWFYCEDLGTQLVPIIKEFFESSQYKTGLPKEDSFLKEPPLIVDTEMTLKNPFSLKNWIDKNRADINSKGGKSLFGIGIQFQAMIYGKGENSGKHLAAETWIWQLEGTSTVTLCGTVHELSPNDTLLIPIGKMYTAKRSQGAISLICFQDPSLKRET